MDSFFIASLGILLPFLGTALGSGTVFCYRQRKVPAGEKVFFGFAAGVMLAASVWSLLLPALAASDSAIPVAGGFLGGMTVFLLGERTLCRRGLSDGFTGARLMAFSVTLHNLPEGMAVGAVFAAALTEEDPAVLSAGLVLSLGIALQNFPEGAVISLPLAGLGLKPGKAFLWGVISGAVEPLGALAALFLTGFFAPLLPLMLSFAAGAMVFVVTKELIPELDGSLRGNFFLCLGFSVMMVLDVTLG